jgi:hypothetical protein
MTKRPPPGWAWCRCGRVRRPAAPTCDVCAQLWKELNAWTPDFAAKRLPCLNCTLPFLSRSKGRRLCDACHARETPEDTWEGPSHTAGRGRMAAS